MANDNINLADMMEDCKKNKQPAYILDDFFEDEEVEE